MTAGAVSALIIVWLLAIKYFGCDCGEDEES